MKINKNITNVNHTAKKRTKNDIKYIVVHYVGALGDAKENTDFFKSINRQASADFFIGFAGDVWQCNDYTTHYSWHCGGGRQTQYGGAFYQKCINANSIGIELCVRKKDTKNLGDWDTDWFFEDATVNSAIELIKSLMQELDIDAEHVIRHYDVNGKICPNPWCDKIHPGAWEQFKARLTAGNVTPATPAAASQIYRVRTAWNKAASQIGAYKVLENAKASCPEGYAVFDSTGKKVYEHKKATASDGSFQVQVTSKVLRIRKSASINAAILGYTGKGIFTITKTSGDWGYLKSGAGWINLKTDCVKRL